MQNYLENVKNLTETIRAKRVARVRFVGTMQYSSTENSAQNDEAVRIARYFSLSFDPIVSAK